MSKNIKPDFRETERDIANIGAGPSTLDLITSATQVYSNIKQNEKQQQRYNHIKNPDKRQDEIIRKMNIS